MGIMGYSTAIVLWRGTWKAFAVSGLSLAFAACAQPGLSPPQLLTEDQSGAASANPPGDIAELQKATQYWGKAYAQNPRDAQTALNYARNLKALGQKQQALAVLQQASLMNANHRGLNSEYGRLALEFDQVSLAQKLLEQADDPANPDWRIISARGTVLAKQGKYRDAIPFYERALALAPNQSSVLNNLALAHAMEGKADKAETLLRQAAASGGEDGRIAQNLSLVLGLQGKYDEAKLVATRQLSSDVAEANVDYLRRIVKLEPKVMTAALEQPSGKAPASPVTGAVPAQWTTQVAATPAQPAP